MDVRRLWRCLWLPFVLSAGWLLLVAYSVWRVDPFVFAPKQPLISSLIHFKLFGQTWGTVSWGSFEVYEYRGHVAASLGWEPENWQYDPLDVETNRHWMIGDAVRLSSFPTIPHSRHYGLFFPILEYRSTDLQAKVPDDQPELEPVIAQAIQRATGHRPERTLSPSGAILLTAERVEFEVVALGAAEVATVGLALALPWIWNRALKRYRRRFLEGSCRSCGYLVSGFAVCPECGTSITPDS